MDLRPIAYFGSYDICKPVDLKAYRDWGLLLSVAIADPVLFCALDKKPVKFTSLHTLVRGCTDVPTVLDITGVVEKVNKKNVYLLSISEAYLELDD